VKSFSEKAKWISSPEIMTSRFARRLADVPVPNDEIRCAFYEYNGNIYGISEKRSGSVTVPAIGKLMHEFNINTLNYFCVAVGKLFFSVPMPAVMHYNIAFFFVNYILCHLYGVGYIVSRKGYCMKVSMYKMLSLLLISAAVAVQAGNGSC